MIVVGDSMQRGLEATICQPDLSSREVFCLPGVWIREVVERLLKLVQTYGCYLLLFFHVGTNDTARGDLESIKTDYRALEEILRDTGAQVLFSVLQGRGRSVRILHIHTWMRSCWWQQGFGFYDRGTLLEDQHLLGRDGDPPL